MTETASLADLKDLPTVHYGSRDPDKLQASILRRKDEIYRQAYAPRERALISTLRDNSIVEEARDNANVTFDRNAEAQSRNLRRYGVDVTSLQRAQLTRNRGLEKTLNYDASLNEARLEQNERNTSLRNALINIGRGIEHDGSTSLSEAVQRQASREAAYDTAKAQHKAQQTQMIGSLGAAAILAFTL